MTAWSLVAIVELRRDTTITSFQWHWHGCMLNPSSHLQVFSVCFQAELHVSSSRPSPWRSALQGLRRRLPTVHSMPLPACCDVVAVLF